MNSGPQSKPVEFGFCRSIGITVYYSLDQAKYVTSYKREGGPVDLSPETIDSEIRKTRSRGDRRKFGAIIQGGPEFMREYRQELREPDFLIFLSSESNLRELGLDVIDNDWKKGMKQHDVNKILEKYMKTSDNPQGLAGNGFVAGLFTVAAPVLLSRWKNRRAAE